MNDDLRTLQEELGTDQLQTPDPGDNGVDALPPIDAAAAAAAAAQQIRALFATLVPTERLELQDALGNRYEARAVLPARAQIIVMQHLQRLWEMEDLPDLGAFTQGGVAGIVGVLMQLAADEQVLNGLSEAFAAAHPAVLQQARDAYTSTGGDKGAHPADLFPVEELIAGLIPFFVRFAARAGDLMNQVQAPTA